jgi:hypothetical protein
VPHAAAALAAGRRVIRGPPIPRLKRGRNIPAARAPLKWHALPPPPEAGTIRSLLPNAGGTERSRPGPQKRPIWRLRHSYGPIRQRILDNTGISVIPHDARSWWDFSLHGWYLACMPWNQPLLPRPRNPPFRPVLAA